VRWMQGLHNVRWKDQGDGRIVAAGQMRMLVPMDGCGEAARKPPGGMHARQRSHRREKVVDSRGSHFHTPKTMSNAVSTDWTTFFAKGHRTPLIPFDNTSCSFQPAWQSLYPGPRRQSTLLSAVGRRNLKQGNLQDICVKPYPPVRSAEARGSMIGSCRHNR